MNTIFRVVFFVGIIPIISGMFIVAYCEDEKKSLIKSYVYGWIVLFAMFELLCVPYVICMKRYSDFSKVYNGCLVLLALVSLGVTLHKYKQKNTLSRKTIQNMGIKKSWKTGITGFLWCLAVVLVALQMGYLIFYQHLDGDDSYYIAESVLTQYFDTMFQRDAYTGMPMGLDVRHALSANPVFITWLSEMCGVHPAVLAHTVLAPVFLMLMYCIYAMTGQAFLKKYRSYVPVFLLFINLWYLWGNVSIYTAETFMYTRTWQGKAMFSNLILPLVVYMLYEAITEGRKIQWVMLTLLSVAGVFVTTAAVYLIPLVYGTVGLGQWIRGKSFRPCFYLMLCCIPCLLFGVIYRYLLAVWR